MNETEYYQAAFDDGAFRREKLDSLRYFRKVEIGLFVVSALGFVATTLGLGLMEGRWDGGGVWLAMLAINAALYTTSSTRLAALEVIQKRVGRGVAVASEIHR
jgi:hypothetical protein